MILQTSFDHKGNEIISFLAYVSLQTFTEVSVEKKCFGVNLFFDSRHIPTKYQTIFHQAKLPMNYLVKWVCMYGIYEYGINWNHVWP